MASPGLSPAYQAVLRELQAEFLSLLPERIGELRSALTLIETDPAARTTVRRLGHRIAGTAATVSLRDLGSVGRAIEDFVASRESWTSSDVALLSGAVELIGEWTSEALRPTDRREVSLIDDPRYVALREAGGGR